MKDILAPLFNGHTLSESEAKQILLDISADKYNDAQIASFLTVFMMRSITSAELSGFQNALLELCIPFDLQGREAIDIVGTGGDGKNTFNISTISAFVIAGAGFMVCKHGNYGVSSACGSSNVLERLGYQFTNDADSLRRQLDEVGLCFLHAPLFHPAMKRVGPVRKQLGMKTFFNMLGPLVNPAQPMYSFLGVYAPEVGQLYQKVLSEKGKEFSVVYSLDGYDEISLTGPFNLYRSDKTIVFHPSILDLPTVAQEDLFGGDDVESAARIFQDILNGDGSPEQEAAVIANAGMAIHCIKPKESIPACLEMARESLQSKQALKKLKQLTQTHVVS